MQTPRSNTKLGCRSCFITSISAINAFSKSDIEAVIREGGIDASGDADADADDNNPNDFEAL